MTAPRRISPNDTKAHEEIHALLHMCFAYMDGRIDPPSSLHQLRVQDIAHHCETGEVWVLGTPLVACVFFTLTQDSLYLGKLAVSPTARGHGYARAFVELAATRAQLLGLPQLELQTRIELTENHAAFRKLGFEIAQYGKHPGYTRATEITMQRKL